MVDKKGRKIGWFRRTVYSLVGLSGVVTFVWIISTWSTFLTMPLWSTPLVALALIAMLNWGVVAISGYNNYDLLKVLGAK